MHRSRETSIAPPATATARNDESLIGLRKFEGLLPGLIVVNDRPDRNLQQHVDALAPGSVRALAMTPTLSLVLRIEAEMYERIVPLARFHNDVAALAAVPARRSAARDKLLPSERHAAVPAVSGLYLDFCLVNKHLNRSKYKSL